MNCARCATPPSKKNGSLYNNYAPLIRLLKVEGGDANHDKFQCPRCRAKFFFKK